VHGLAGVGRELLEDRSRPLHEVQLAYGGGADSPRFQRQQVTTHVVLLDEAGMHERREHSVHGRLRTTHGGDDLAQ